MGPGDQSNRMLVERNIEFIFVRREEASTPAVFTRHTHHQEYSISRGIPIL